MELLLDGRELFVGQGSGCVQADSLQLRRPEMRGRAPGVQPAITRLL